MRLFTVLLLAGVLGLAGPALAREKGSRPAPAAAPAPLPPPTDADTQALSELVQAGAPYQALVIQSERFMGEVLQVGKLVAVEGQAPSPAAIAQWKAQVLRDEAVIRAQRAALPAFPSAKFARFRSDPQGARLLDAMEGLPKVSGDIADRILALTDTMLPLVDRVAAGDKTAEAPLGAAVLDGLIATIKGENALLDLSLSSSIEGHPQTALVRSMKASNEALMILLQMGQMDDSQKTELTAMAQTLVGRLDEAESQARKVGPLAQYMLKSLEGEPIAADLRPRLEGMLATYAESGNVELQIDDAIRRMIVKLADNPKAADEIGEELRPLVERRVELQNLRTQQFSG